MFFFLKAVESDSDLVEKYYTNHGTFHNDDSGLDLYCLRDQTIGANTHSNIVHLGIKVMAKNNSVNAGFYLYPRSSMGSKTPLRLSNSVGIIDAGYRGELMALVDNISDKDYIIKEGDRYFQICSPTLSPVQFKLCEELDETERGEKGFGST